MEWSAHGTGVPFAYLGTVVDEDEGLTKKLVRKIPKVTTTPTMRVKLVIT